MPDILKKENADLLIVGEFVKDKQKYLDLISELNIKNHVKIIDNYVPNEKVSLYFSASDIVVVPYEIIILLLNFF